MKFGGTSVGSGQRILNAAAIVLKEKDHQPVVVVSAMSQVTNTLVELSEMVTRKKQQSKLTAAIKHLRALHHEAARELKLEPAAEKDLLTRLDGLIDHLDNILNSIYSLGELTPRGNDLILSFGERLSIHLVAAALEHRGLHAAALDANNLIITDNNYGNAQPLLQKSARKMKAKIQQLVSNNITPVITGFFAGTSEGVITTLGRGGSDYSATIIGHCLEADEVWIWTDVEGVMTADPRLVKGTQTVTELSYDEAAELSYFGAKVLHPRTMVPAALSGIPIFIKNTMRPEARGTQITKNSHKHDGGAKAITVLNHLSLITVQGKGMQGVFGVAAKVFTTLAEHKVNVLFISQASSENNISLVSNGQDGERAARALRKAFHSELVTRSLETVNEEPHLAMIAVIGDGLRSHSGISGHVFSALGRQDINVIAVAQGSSERNLSFIVSEAEAPLALQSIHDELRLAKHGRIGAAA